MRGSSGKGDGRGMVGSMSMVLVSLGSSVGEGGFFFGFSFLSFLFFQALAVFAVGPLDNVILTAIKDFILDVISGRRSWAWLVGDGGSCSMGIITLCGFSFCVLVLCYRPFRVSCFPFRMVPSGLWTCGGSLVLCWALA